MSGRSLTMSHTRTTEGGAARTAVNAAAVQPSSEHERAVQRALTFILRSTQHRPQTEAELATKLRSRDLDEPVVDAAIAQAKKVGAIDDDAFARAWVADRGGGRGYGAARIRRELTQRQVPDELIEAALGALDGRDEEAVATELARARVRRLPASLPPETAARRLIGYLVRRGYPPGLAQRVARSASGIDRAWD